MMGDPRDSSGRTLLGIGVGSLGALGAAAGLVGIRGEIQNANVALVLVVFVLVGAVTGGRTAGAVSAVGSASGLPHPAALTRPGRPWHLPGVGAGATGGTRQNARRGDRLMRGRR